MPGPDDTNHFRQIVIVDDNRSFTVLLRSVLWEFGFRDILDFERPEHALEHMRTTRVDVAFIDLVMPGINGFKLADMIRHSDDLRNRAMPIIMITGHADRGNIQRAINHGIDEVLVKPIRPRHVYDRLRSVLDNPRVYIKTRSGYFGPDRRRRNDPNYRGPERRKSDDHEVFTGSSFVHIQELRAAERMKAQAEQMNARRDPAPAPTPPQGGTIPIDSDIFILD